MTTAKTVDPERIARYSDDDTPVQEGDRIRYHQAPGGLMSPPMHFRNGEFTPWTEGVAVLSERPIFGKHEIVLKDAAGRHYGLVGHVIERLEKTEGTTEGEAA